MHRAVRFHNRMLLRISGLYFFPLPFFSLLFPPIFVALFASPAFPPLSLILFISISPPVLSFKPSPRGTLIHHQARLHAPGLGHQSTQPAAAAATSSSFWCWRHHHHHTALQKENCASSGPPEPANQAVQDGETAEAKKAQAGVSHRHRLQATWSWGSGDAGCRIPDAAPALVFLNLTTE